MENFGIHHVYFFAYVATGLQLKFFIIHSKLPGYYHACGAALFLQRQCLKCSVGCNVDDQMENELNALTCHKVKMSYFIRLMILIKGIYILSVLYFDLTNNSSVYTV